MKEETGSREYVEVYKRPVIERRVNVRAYNVSMSLTNFYITAC